MLYSLNISLLSKFISKVCNDVASENHITVQSIFDKITRQIGLNKKQFTQMLLDFYVDVLRGNSDKSKLREKLLEYASKNTKNDDISFITHSATELSKKYA